MLKRITVAAAVAALAVVMMPVASEAGTHAKKGEARPACGLTKMLDRVSQRTERAVRSITHHTRKR